MPKPKIAVVLFNLGGPDSPRAVRPFLFNLFNDPAIISLPGPVRWLLARFISWRRAPVARAIYGQIGGRSPLLQQTVDQAEALASLLHEDFRPLVTIAMRYWHPRAESAAQTVRDFRPDHVVLLPLYPQFSTTTSGSSFSEWREAAAAVGLDAPTASICCYPQHRALVAAHAALIGRLLTEAEGRGPLRILFSAHGLPKKVIERGDPYQWQVEQTAAAIVEALGARAPDWTICYQSRVGPMEWIGPATKAEIARAGREGVAIMVVPIAFVSEHSETLVELDIAYRALAKAAGVPNYLRVPALHIAPNFIAALATLVRGAIGGTAVRPANGAQPCPAGFSGCPANGAHKAL